MKDKVRNPSVQELAWLRQAEEFVNDISYRYFYDETGEGQLDHSELDLMRARHILRDEKYRADQLYELQCLGVVLGNVFVANTPMEWKVVTNDFGRNLALRHPVTGFVLYPITMISKRVEAGRAVDIEALYHSFVNDLGLKKPAATRKRKSAPKKPAANRKSVGTKRKKRTRK